MAPKKISAAVAAAFDDELSVIDPSTFARGALKNKNRVADVAVREDGSKRHKTLVSRKPSENKLADLVSSKERRSSTSASDRAVEPIKGKGRFYHESIRLTQDMVEGQLSGFGRLVLAPKPGDYGEVRLYSGSSSLGDWILRRKSLTALLVL